VPPALLLASIAALVIALARPHVTTRVPVGKASIMLVTDHSGSMQATDVQPTRLAAAERAARTFIGELPAQVRVGVVTFSGAPDAVQAPTSDRRRVLGIIDGQEAIGATDTGDALGLALQLLRSDGPRTPTAVVLLSDGATTRGPDPVEVAGQAGARRIPVYTVALGNADTTIPDPEGVGPPVPVPPDPELLGRIARASGGQAFTAEDEGRLTAIYSRLGARLGSRPRSEEVTVAFLLAGAVLLLGAGVASVWVTGRLP
jgi:Ca-activated chloride channel family protein